MKNNSYVDTYFFDANTALEEAKKANRVKTPNPRITGLQICYYNADEPFENAPENCIWVPFENVYNYFVTTKNRFPRTFNFDNSIYTSHEQYQIANMFNETIQVSKNERKALVDLYVEEVKKYTPNFKDEKLRIFIPACRETTVMQYISKNIAKAFKKYNNDYEIEFYMQDTEMQTCQDMLPFFHAINEFKPHITININHYNNTFLNDSIINIVWFQDRMPAIVNDSDIKIRDNDYTFHLTSMLNRTLEKKGINSLYQPFCLDEITYQERDDIQRKKKIVFVGSSYKDRIEEIKDDEDFNIIYDDMLTLFKEKGCLTSIASEQSDIKYFTNKYKKPASFIDEIYAYIGRDYCVEYICQLDTNYEIEIYGYGWENNKIVSPYFKGILNHGKEISKIYNSADYGYCPGGYVLMQRTLECAFSGAIPLISEVRADKEDEYDLGIEESLQFFTINTLEKILTEDKKKCKFDLIRDQYSYKSFVEKIIKIIKMKV